MTTSLLTFGRGGIHPSPSKGATSERPIEDLPTPRVVRLPLLQHIGAPAVPIVKKGDEVRRGQVIAEAHDGGVPLHATISGKVKPIARHPHPSLVQSEAIVIAGKDDLEPLEFEEDPGWRELPRDEVLSRIRDAGIVGLGGAAFPTYRKLTLPQGVTVDILVINGAECEPYLTSDFRIMIEHAREVVEGALAMANILGVCRVLIGVEADKSLAVEALQKVVHDLEGRTLPVGVVPCETRYPQGAERQLVHAVTGRSVPLRQLPSAVGVMVQNVATAAAVCDAVRCRRPLLDRVVTVTGPGVHEPKNVRVPIGTLLQDLVTFCGGLSDGTTRLIAGGPMMGRALPRLDIPVVKGMNGLIALEGRGPFEEGFGPCISCGACLDVCPLGLEPDQVSIRVEAGRPVDTESFGALDCYECGCCTYVCPAERPLVQFMQVAKSALRRAEALKVTE